MIIAKNIYKRFKDVVAVNGVSFAVEKGEFFGILGPNGAGKTSTLRMLCCLSPLGEGFLTVMDREVKIDDRVIKSNIGIIPQESDLDVDLTVYENLYLFSKFYGIENKKTLEVVEDALVFTELKTKSNSKINDLSSGMRRRLLIARALLNSPKLIVMDEPTIGLDPQARHFIWQRLRRLNKGGTTMLLTTQYMEEAEQLCSRIIIMDKGKVIAGGNPKEMIRKEIGTEVVEIRVEDESIVAQIEKNLQNINCRKEKIGDTVYIHSRNDNPTTSKGGWDNGRDIVNRLSSLGHINIHYRPATLEDVFLKLTGRGLTE